MSTREPYGVKVPIIHEKLCYCPKCGAQAYYCNTCKCCHCDCNIDKQGGFAVRMEDYEL